MPLSEPIFRASAASRANGRPAVGAGGAAPGDQPQAIQFDGDVGAHECHRLPTRDGLAERLSLLHVRYDVIEHGVAGADGQRRPAQPRQGDGFGIVAIGGVVAAEAGRQRDRNLAELNVSQRRCPQSHAAISGNAEPGGVGLDDEQGGLSVELRCDDEQFGVGGRGHQGLDPVETIAAGRTDRDGLAASSGRTAAAAQRWQGRPAARYRPRTRRGRWPAGRRCPSESVRRPPRRGPGSAAPGPYRRRPAPRPPARWSPRCAARRSRRNPRGP